MTSEARDLSVVMPRLGESIVEATIVRFRVKPGDEVTRGQILAEVETDKATSEIPAPSTGIVRALLAEEGATVPVGAPILAMSSGPRTEPAPLRPQDSGLSSVAASKGPHISANPPQPPGSRLPSAHLAPRPFDERGGPVRSSPAVRRLARRHGLDITRIDGSGKNGRVTRDDIIRLLGRAGVAEPAQIQATVESKSAPPPQGANRSPHAETPTEPRLYGYVPPTYQPTSRDRVIPFSRRRGQIAGHMIHSLRTAAHVFALAELDMSRVLAARQADAPAAERADVKLTFLPYVVSAVARALAEHPELNATVVNDAHVLRAERNIGIAVDTSEGLVVPVVHRADELGLLGIARALGELSERARTGRLTPSDVSGGSFSISNPGKNGNLVGLSIIRQPEVAILRLGSIEKRPVVRELEGEDAVVIRPIMCAALSYDHRVIDGRTANAFLSRLTELIASTRPTLG